MARTIGRGGRAITKSFSYPKDFDSTILIIEKVCRKEGKSFSDVLVELLKQYAKEHAKSENPQTTIPLFETGLENAIPNVYEIIKHPEKLQKFYKLIKKREEFKYLDKGLNIWFTQHNKRDKEIP